jgi:hypothetical protein
VAKEEEERPKADWNYLLDDILSAGDPELLVHSVLGAINYLPKFQRGPRDFICNCHAKALQHEPIFGEFGGNPWICPFCNATLTLDGIGDTLGLTWACHCKYYFRHRLEPVSEGVYRLRRDGVRKPYGMPESWSLILYCHRGYKLLSCVEFEFGNRLRRGERTGATRGHGTGILYD